MNSTNEVDSNHSVNDPTENVILSDSNANKNCNSYPTEEINDVICFCKSSKIDENNQKVNNNTGENYSKEPQKESECQYNKVNPDSVQNFKNYNGCGPSNCLVENGTVASCSNTNRKKHPILSNSHNDLLHCQVCRSQRNGVGYAVSTENSDEDKNTSKEFSKQNGEPIKDMLVNDYENPQPGPSSSKKKNERSAIYSRRRLSSSSESSFSSDTGNNDRPSNSDDCCVYTYKGGDSADLPDCFFVDLRESADDDAIPPIENGEIIINNVEQPLCESSSEMDYLEMDFDPGPSCEANSESSLELDLDQQDEPHLNGSYVHENCENHLNNGNENTSSDSRLDSEDINQPSTSGRYHNYSTTNNFVLNNTESECQERQTQTENIIVSKIPLLVKQPVIETMLWTEKEANSKQFNLPSSSNGFNAIFNVLNVLRKVNGRTIPDCVLRNEHCRQTESKTPLVQFLLSKSKEIISGTELISKLTDVTNGSVYARFFSTWPKRNIPLLHWLSYWLNLGVVPIATRLHISNFSEHWRHQMIFGVSSTGVYVTDPVQCISENIFLNELTADSVMLVNQEDILAHWNPDTDLRLLASIKDPAWHKLNVLGKVVNIIRESQTGYTSFHSYHILIPTTCRAGITLVADIENKNACEILKNCAELPFSIE